MGIMARIRYEWHCYWYCFNERLLNQARHTGKEKAKIRKKINYHRTKMFSV